MKTCFLLFAIVISHTLYAQSSWKPLGGNGGLVSDPNISRSTDPTIVTDVSGTPYVAYTATSDSLKIVVKKYVGSGWQTIGVPASTFRGRNPSIAISSKDTIYVGFLSKNDSEKPVVIKYDGTAWVQVGNPIIYGGGGLFETSLAIDSNDKLYFGFAAFNFPSYPPGKANIFTYDGTDWVQVGHTDFVQYSGRMSLRIGLNNELYVGYNTYYHTGHTATSSWVQKWDGSQWDTVGTGFQYITNIDIAPDGTVYTLHEGAATGQGWYAVEKLVNNAWVQQGSTQAYYDAWLKTDKQGVPYISFAESNGSSAQVSIKKYDGFIWRYLGSKAFTNAPNSVSNTRIAFDKKNLPVITYQTNATVNEKVYSWCYDSVLANVTVVNNAQTIHVYPNPVTEQESLFLIDAIGLPLGEYTIALYNALGQVQYKTQHILRQQSGMSLIVQPEHSLMKGVYYLMLTSKSSVYRCSVLVQ